MNSIDDSISLLVRLKPPHFTVNEVITPCILSRLTGGLQVTARLLELVLTTVILAGGPETIII